MVHTLASESLKVTLACSEKTKQCSEKQRTPKMMIHPGQQEDRQRVIARLEDDEQLSASGVWHEIGLAGEWVHVHHAQLVLL